MSKSLIFIYSCIQISKNLSMLIDTRILQQTHVKSLQASNLVKEMKVACEKFLQNLFRCRKLVVATVQKEAARKQIKSLTTGFCVLASNSQNPHPEIKLQIEVSGSVAAGSSVFILLSLEKPWRGTMTLLMLNLNREGDKKTQRTYVTKK